MKSAVEPITIGRRYDGPRYESPANPFKLKKNITAPCSNAKKKQETPTALRDFTKIPLYGIDGKTENKGEVSKVIYK